MAELKSHIDQSHMAKVILLCPVQGSSAVGCDFIVWRKPAATFLQLSRPQPFVATCVREEVPPVSIGFDAFAARMEQELASQDGESEEGGS
ncbi:uncharacterized protein BXZ73DRAFT_98764 [Epithele typhae]|uniref:uncharacterized protein n=1 Tax=Epithele typhae TaxID=378194 RepID=UPI002007E084|nr:uncharacterized protein BXZ73DRAFT_98764 [Epithele typhae]KAH9940936.1 hypothetical protein BXZ73DRAFT_98764 [Epithele typhae]